MVVVDSCVWIDYFDERTTSSTQRLDNLLLAQEALIGDLIATEVLQGFRNSNTFRDAAKFFNVIGLLQIVDPNVAFQAAENYRFLRSRGITPRGTIDTLIATRCIMDGLALLTSDRDFEPFARHLGLVLA
jgi:predicted nucleic acid-binding protein